MAKNPFNIGIFNGPSYSGFSIKHGNRVSTKAGVMKPVWCDYLDTGERLKDLDLGALVRQAPMLAPTLDTYEVTVDAFAVRLTLFFSRLFIFFSFSSGSVTVVFIYLFFLRVLCIFWIAFLY